MRGFFTGVLQVLLVAAGMALVSGLIGILVFHFAGWGSAAKGLGYGMLVAGSVVGFAASNSGSPGENLVRGRSGAFGTYWGQSAALPQSPIQLALGGLLTFAAGVGVLLLVYT